jgi:hypothetical protein
MTTGITNEGLIMEETKMMYLNFTIPKQSTVPSPFIELWLFPDKSHAPPNKTLELRFLIQAFIPPTTTKPKSTQQTFLWNTNEDCVYLNLTFFSNKLLRVIQNKRLNESNVKLKVEVYRRQESDQDIQNSTINISRQDLCASLSHRRSNNSFLIIKNYDESTAPLVIPQSNRVSKRDILQVEPSEPSETTFTTPCRVVPLMANMTEVYGDFIRHPILTDIKDCSGRCTLLLDRPSFTKHAEIKERLKLLPGGEVLSKAEPSCMPIAFKPLYVQIKLKGSSDVIVQFQDLVVDRCACQ